MTTATRVNDLIREVRSDGLRLRAEGDKLIVQGDPAARDRWRQALTAAKVEILAALVEPANDPVSTDIDRRLERLMEIGAIDADDADLCRARYADDTAMWDLLLDACERATRGRRRSA